ncbi:lytic transglycosylase domain-containing protein [Pelotomaculum sp. PtaB.Bin117]|uniref:lytic transglycosylase domain-containing protein n=1 Tax=Pelotomaculum sp. PtaB.Bin117 TaxID=1811694 RepID=UPI00338EBD6A
MIVLTAALRKRFNSGRIKRRIYFLLLVLLILFNFDYIARIFYQFPYQDTTYFYADKYHVDPFLLAAIMKTESDFNNQAVSDKGARGLMQIMPETGQWIVHQMGEPAISMEKLLDPETSIKLGAWYIADLGKEFNGDTVLILAAYNGGRGNVEDWLDRKELRGGGERIEQIPFPETRFYVRKVLLYQQIYRYLYNTR